VETVVLRILMLAEVSELRWKRGMNPRGQMLYCMCQRLLGALSSL